MRVLSARMNADQPPATLGPTAQPAGWLRRSHAALYAAVALTVVHFVWLATHHAAAINSPDANGYVVQGRLIANDGRTSFAAESPVQFTGMHWLETGAGVYHSRYPAGLPLLYAAAWKIGGLNAALWINPVLASATLFLVFGLARRFVGDWFAVLAAASVGVVPVFNQHALDADAHIAAVFLLVGGVLALLWFGGGKGIGVGLLAGFLLGAVPSVRYPEALAGFAIAGWLAGRVRPLRSAWPVVAGAVVPLAALSVHNAAAYGAFWRTGYALTGEQTGFGLNYFASHAIPYLQAMSGPGLGVMFGFGAGGLAALVADRRHRAEGMLCAGIAVPLLLLYMAYYFGGGPGAMGGGAVTGNLRFLIPVFPFFAIGAVWLLEAMGTRLGSAGGAAVAIVGGLQLVIGVASTTPTLTQTGAALRGAARAAEVAEKEIPAGSVVIVDRTLAESLDAHGRWKLAEEGMLSGMMPGPGLARGGAADLGGRGPRFAPAGRGPGAAGGPSPQQPGKNRNQQERYRGLTASERQAQIWSDLQQWAGGRPIFWFARSLDAVDAALPRGADYRTVAEIELPTMMGPGAAMRPGGAGMMVPGRGGRGAFGPPGMRGENFGPPDGPEGRGFIGNVGTKLRVIRLELPKT